MDEAIVRKAKIEAKRRGKSVSRMVVPPTTASLLGILKGHKVSEDGYKEHLRKKYL